MRVLKKILKIIDSVSIVQGYVMAIALLVLIFLVVFEVIMRYVFNAPTIWGTELQLFIYAGILLLTTAFTLQRGMHARVDLMVNFLSPRTREVVAFLTYLLFFLPFTLIIFIKGIGFAAASWKILETSVWSGWQPPLYPIKTIIPIAFLMLLCQGLAEMTRHGIAIFKGEKP
jgi:TRAP-type mannitol/chloroaromatic compound transport system permease small subunit